MSFSIVTQMLPDNGSGVYPYTIRVVDCFGNYYEAVNQPWTYIYSTWMAAVYAAGCRLISGLPEANQQQLLVYAVVAASWHFPYGSARSRLVAVG